MTKNFVLDAWALLAFLQGEDPAASRVREMIEGAQAGGVRLFVSILNVGEVYYRVGKTQGPKEADSVLGDLYLLPIEIISVDDETVLAAARLKMIHLIPYTDAFAAITTHGRSRVVRIEAGRPHGEMAQVAIKLINLKKFTLFSLIFCIPLIDSSPELVVG